MKLANGSKITFKMEVSVYELIGVGQVFPLTDCDGKKIAHLTVTSKTEPHDKYFSVATTVSLIVIDIEPFDMWFGTSEDNFQGKYFITSIKEKE